MQFWQITETDRGFDYWRSRDYLSKETRAAVQTASFLIVPQEGFRDLNGQYFANGTEDFFRHVRENVPESVSAEICIDDEAFQEIALHSAFVALATFVVTAVVMPLAVNMVSGYIDKRKLKGNIHVRMIVQGDDPEAPPALMEYEGPATDFAGAAKEVLQLQSSNGAGARALKEPEDQ